MKLLLSLGVVLLAGLLGASGVGAQGYPTQPYTTPVTTAPAAVGYGGVDLIVQTSSGTTWCTAANTIISNAQGTQWLPASACPFSAQSAIAIACGNSVWVGGQFQGCQPPVTYSQPPQPQTFAIVNTGGNFCGSNQFSFGLSSGCGFGCGFSCGQNFFPFGFNRGNFCNFPGSCGQGRPNRPDRDRPDEPEPTPTVTHHH